MVKIWLYSKKNIDIIIELDYNKDIGGDELEDLKWFVSQVVVPILVAWILRPKEKPTERRQAKRKR